MNEADELVTEQPLNQNRYGVRMPYLVKAAIWDKPLFFLFFGLLMLGISSPLIILIYHAVKNGRLLQHGSPILLMALSVPAFFLCTALVAFVLLLRRKLKTGGFLYSRVVLDAMIASSMMPQPLRKRIVAAVIYCLIASNQTYVATISHRYPQFIWGFTIFMWLITAIFTVNIFHPIKQMRTTPTLPEEELPAKQ
jgi:hypothetical protein